MGQACEFSIQSLGPGLHSFQLLAWILARIQHFMRPLASPPTGPRPSSTGSEGLLYTPRKSRQEFIQPIHNSCRLGVISYTTPYTLSGTFEVWYSIRIEA